jgi:hypothetical protein
VFSRYVAEVFPLMISFASVVTGIIIIIIIIIIVVVVVVVVLKSRLD